MKRIAFVLLLSLFCCGVPVAALADSGAPPAPVVSIDAGIAPIAAPTPAPATPTTFPDPQADPAGFVSSVLTFGETNWPLGVGLGVFGLLELLIWLGASVPKLQALGKGRTTLVLGGAAAVLSAGLHAIIGGGSTQTALLAAVVAVATFWHPAATDVAIAKTTRKIAAAVNVAILGLVLACSVAPSCSGAQKLEQNGLACAGEQVDASLLEEVALDLFTKNFTDLESLAASKGLAFVNCVVTTTVASQPTVPAGSSAQALAPSPIAVNGAEWLATHPVGK